MNPVTNTREGLITAPVDAALTAARLAVLDDDGKAVYPEAGAIGRFVVVESSADTATLAPIDPGRQIRVTLSGTCDPGDGLKPGANGVAVAAGEGDAVSLVAEEAGIDGQDVLSRGPTGIPAYTPNELPAIEEGDAGKVLTVADDETGFELATPEAGGGDLVPIGDANECPSGYVVLMNESNLPTQSDPMAETEAAVFPVYDIASVLDGMPVSPEDPGGGLMFTTKAGLLGLLGLSPTLAGLTFRAVTGQLNGSGSASVAAASGKSIIVAVAYGNASPVAVAQASLPAWAILTGDASDDYVLYLLEVPVTNPDIE